MSEQENGKKLVVYVGNDDSYWGSLMQRYRETAAGKKIDFKKIFNPDDKVHYNTFIEIIKSNADIIYVDVTTKKPYFFKLLRLLGRQDILKEKALVALVNDEEKMIKCRNAGISFIYVKGLEMYDVAFHPYKYACPEDAGDAIFATAECQKDFSVLNEIKLGYVTTEIIHAEGNQQLSEGQFVELESDFLKGLLSCLKFKVKKVEKSDIYHNFEYYYEMEFLFVDEPNYEEYAKERDEKEAQIKEESNPAELDYAMKDFNEKYPPTEELKETLAVEKDEASVKLKEYVQSFEGKFKPKKTKILIVDPTMKVLTDTKKDFDEFPFLLRPQVSLLKDTKLIDKWRPKVIVYSLPGLEENGKENGKENDKENDKEEENLIEEELRKIKGIVKKIESLKKYSPIMLIFNSGKLDKDEVKKNLGYKFLVIKKRSIEIDKVIEMGHFVEKQTEKETHSRIMKKLASVKKASPDAYKKLEAKIFAKDKKTINMDMLPPGFAEVEKKFIDRDHAVAFIKRQVTLIKMSESEIGIQSDDELRLDVFRITEPAKFSFTLIPIEGKPYVMESGKYVYQGLIHSLDETDKQDIRAFVNSLFLAEKDEKRRVEQEEFEKKKEEAMKKKEEE